MISLGLNASQLAEYISTLFRNHDIRVQVLVTNLEHQVTGDISSALLDGQVDGKAEELGGWRQSTASRLRLWDPKRELRFDTTRPLDGQLFFNRMIQLIYSVRTSFGWVEAPVFTGPIVAAYREGPFISVECLGKEHLARSSSYTARTFKKNRRKVEVIRELLELTGETSEYMNFPVTNHRLPNDMVLVGEDNIWEKAIYLAQSMGMFLYYDTRGIAQLKKPLANVVFTFRDQVNALPSVGPNVLSEPQPRFETDNIRNVVRVIGGPKVQGKPTPTATIWAPSGHPLSPWSLGRGEEPRILMDIIEDRDIRTAEEATKVATKALEQHLRKFVHVSFDALPVPFLEPWDICAVQTEGIIIPFFRLTEYSFPLRFSGQMSIGSRRTLMTKDTRRVSL